MSEESVKTSNELIRWLKMLALAAWAGFARASIMLLIWVQDFGFPVRTRLNAQVDHA